MITSNSFSFKLNCIFSFKQVHPYWLWKNVGTTARSPASPLKPLNFELQSKQSELSPDFASTKTTVWLAIQQTVHDEFWSLRDTTIHHYVTSISIFIRRLELEVSQHELHCFPRNPYEWGIHHVKITRQQAAGTSFFSCHASLSGCIDTTGKHRYVLSVPTVYSMSN